MIPSRRVGNAWGYPGIAILALAITTASVQGQPTGGLSTAGPAKAAIEQWFAGGHDIVCTDATGADQACDVGRILALKSSYDDAGNGLAFVTYTPAVSNAVALAVGQFRNAGSGWTLVRKIEGIYGEGPKDVTFDGTAASFTMAALMPGDARCCLTGTQRYRIDLASGRVTAGPRVAAGGPPPRPVPSPAGQPQGTAFTHNGSIVFPSETGTPIGYPNIVNRQLGPLQVALGIVAADGSPRWTAHSFRHFAVSLWIDEGAKIGQISEWAGHESPEFTQRVYGHLFHAGRTDRRAVTAGELSVLGAIEPATPTQHGNDNALKNGASAIA